MQNRQMGHARRTGALQPLPAGRKDAPAPTLLRSRLAQVGPAPGQPPPKACRGRRAAPAATDGTADAGGKGVISLLQEYVQCTTFCPGPRDRPVLQWSFDERVSAGAVEFRATVALALDGVPHHVVGGWHASKKAAQRDAADRALGFFVGSWGEALLCQADTSQSCASLAAPASGGGVTALEERQALAELCGSDPSCGGKQPAWSCRWEGGTCIASAELEILGVRHQLAGVPCGDEQAAITAAARRILWYLRCPGYEGTFELDPQAPAVAAREIPTAPADWVNKE